MSRSRLGALDADSGREFAPVPNPAADLEWETVLTDLPEADNVLMSRLSGGDDGEWLESTTAVHVQRHQ